MPLESSQLPARGDVPELGRAVEARTGQQGAGPVERDAPHRLAVTGHHVQRLRGVRPPDPYGAVVPAGKTILLPLGFAVSVPPAYELQIRARSSLALKGLLVANSPGTVDSGYHGEVAVLLLNTTDSDYKIEQGDRIAQVVPASVPFAEFVDDPRHWESERGDGGFGSSGV